MTINGVFIGAVFCQEWWVWGVLKCSPLIKCSFLFSALILITCLWCPSVTPFTSHFFCLFDYMSFYTVPFCRFYSFFVHSKWFQLCLLGEGKYFQVRIWCPRYWDHHFSSSLHTQAALRVQSDIYSRKLSLPC